MFQGRPDLYDLYVKLHTKHVDEEDTWYAPKYANDMEVGDSVLLWRSRPDGGIVAVGEISSPVREMPVGEWRWDVLGKHATEPRVSFRYRQILKRPILRQEVLQHPILQNMLIIRCPPGTVFPVTTEEWRAIESMLSGR